MKKNVFKNIGILGAGHIGGSFAKAIRVAIPDANIVVGDTDIHTRAAVLTSGCANESFDPTQKDPCLVFAGMDLLILAMPPEAVKASVRGFARSGIGLITDVASVKKPIIEAASGLGNFAGGHPMAGTEGSGFEASNPKMFHNAAFIITLPPDFVAKSRLEAYKELLMGIGFRIFEMSAAEHDKRLAIISHLPHVAAFALSHLALEQRDTALRMLVGGGFRDTTRIAASSPALWTDILRGSPELPAAIDAYIEELQRLRDMLPRDVSEASLRRHLVEAESYRRIIPDGLNKVPHAQEKPPKKFALIGHPLGHSLSPAIHEQIMKEAGIAGSYELIDIEPELLPARLPALLREFDGFNVTIPHKQAVIPSLKDRSVAARRCGAVNTIFENAGYNTDSEGFLSYGIELKDAQVLVLGTGGTARMMASESIAAGAATLVISSRSKENAEALIAHLKSAFPGSPCKISMALTVEELDVVLANATVLLNGTPLGMWPRSHGIPVQPEKLHSRLTVFDPIYNPTPTRLVLNARKAGAKAYGGLDMLVRQAVAAQKIWNPEIKIASEDLVERILPQLRHHLLDKHHIKILLTGFMGCGKSSVGRILARRLGVAFCDLDEEIVRVAGIPIAQIFKEDGEDLFRAYETRVATHSLARSGSAVIATGGGFPVRDLNRLIVRHANAIVIGIEGSFDDLWTRISDCGARPLAQSRESTYARYMARLPIYREFCDAYVTTDNGVLPDDVANKILQLLSTK